MFHIRLFLRDPAREGIRPEKGSGQRRDQIHIITESKGGFVIIYLWIFHTRARTTRTLFSKDKKQSNENASKASKQYLIIKFYMWDPGPACKRSDRTQVKKKVTGSTSMILQEVTIIQNSDKKCHYCHVK